MFLFGHFYCLIWESFPIQNDLYFPNFIYFSAYFPNFYDVKENVASQIKSLACKDFKLIQDPRVCNLKFSYFSNQNICCRNSKDPSQCSFEHPKHMLKLMGKKLFTILYPTNVYLNLHVCYPFFHTGNP